MIHLIKTKADKKKISEMLEFVEFQSLINIRPGQNNRSMEIQDQEIRQKLEHIVRSLLEI